jgi:hypothetical protein
MPYTTEQRAEFEGAIRALRETAAGREASMYQPLSDLFVDFLGYSRRNIDIDTSGPRGRPDLTIYAPGGGAGRRVPWIVVEAKDEKNAVADPRRRLTLYGGKAKYITADTAFIVMVDPTMLVARGAAIGSGATADIELPLVGQRSRRSRTHWRRCERKSLAFRSRLSASAKATRASSLSTVCPCRRAAIPMPSLKSRLPVTSPGLAHRNDEIPSGRRSPRAGRHPGGTGRHARRHRHV